eukprot:7457752-Alexandrium_andersonii.AAC.1
MKLLASVSSQRAPPSSLQIGAAPSSLCLPLQLPIFTHCAGTISALRAALRLHAAAAAPRARAALGISPHLLLD